MMFLDLVIIECWFCVGNAWWVGGLGAYEVEEVMAFVCVEVTGQNAQLVMGQAH